jgi:hypothetical protein
LAHTTDSSIFQLVNTEALATLTGFSRPKINTMYLSGLIPGADVEGRGVVFRPQVAPNLQKKPEPVSRGA